jgi:hypothetical protein
MARSFPSTLAALLLLLAAAAPAARAAVPKTVKVAWTPPGNTADEMDRPKLLNCGDTLRLVCAPGEKHGARRARVAGAAFVLNGGRGKGLRSARIARFFKMKTVNS